MLGKAIRQTMFGQ